MDPVVVAVFLLVYVGMIVGEIPRLRLDRTGFALVGAIALVGSGRMTTRAAWAAIDVPTMALLFGLMVISAQFRVSGFYAALTRAALCDAASAADRTQHHEALAAHHRQLQEWAENCPENFEDRAALVAAELARIEGRDAEAMRLYERAIAAARANGFVDKGALAYELAARFYSARGFAEISRLYLRNARHGYLQWGADGKVRQLDELNPYLRHGEPEAALTGTIAAPVEHPDVGMPEVPQRPPGPGRRHAVGRVVHDDRMGRADPVPAHRRLEGLWVGQRMTARAGGSGQLAVEVDERRSGQVPSSIGLDARRPAEAPAHIEKGRRIG